MGKFVAVLLTVWLLLMMAVCTELVSLVIVDSIDDKVCGCQVLVLAVAVGLNEFAVECVPFL